MRWSLLLPLLFLLTLNACASGDDDDDASPSVDDDVADDDNSADDDVVDDDTTDDDTVDDDLIDDDTVDDDSTDDDLVDDDAVDDDTAADDYVAPWPQDTVAHFSYDETGEPGPLRQKAMDYDAWHLAWHQPDHGGCVHVHFEDVGYTTPVLYEGFGDSTIWTGVYLGSESLRYHVTGEQQAKENAMAKVRTLDGHLHVTGTNGFISRFRGSQDIIDLYGGDEWCDNYNRCHRVNDGEYAGDFWIGETSRDQYTGWFYGMALAYDLIDDEETRQIIRDDVTEVLDQLLADHWWIIDEAGEPTDAAPQVLPPMQLAWITIGYHVTGLERFRVELQKHLRDSYRPIIQIETIATFNRYAEYYGNNLSHTNWYNVLRLGKAYFSPADYAFMLKVFENEVHTFTRLSHNPWFNAIFMGQGDYTPSRADEYQAQLEEDLATFREPPLVEFYLPARDPSTYTLDPISVFLHDLEVQYPFLEDLIGEINYQAQDPFTVDLQCTAGFMFQWNPFAVEECGADNLLHVNSGHDYLAAYWMASYGNFLSKSD